MNAAKLYKNAGKMVYVYSVDLKERMRAIEKQLDQQKAMWNELKEWLGRVNQVYMNDGFFDCAGAICEVIDKTQELEKGEKDD